MTGAPEGKNINRKFHEAFHDARNSFLDRIGASGSAECSARPIIADLLPRAEVARQFDVCQRTLRRWEKSRQGPPVIRVGKRVFYRGEAVRRWLLEQEGSTMS